MQTQSVNITDRDDLIREVLKTIVSPWAVDQIEFIQAKQMARAMITHPEVKDLSKPIVLTWDNRKAFFLYSIESKRGSVLQMPVPSDRWYRVARILETRFLASEKLKI